MFPLLPLSWSLSPLLSLFALALLIPIEPVGRVPECDTRPSSADCSGPHPEFTVLPGVWAMTSMVRSSESLHRLAVDGHDNVARLQARLLRRALRRSRWRRWHREYRSAQLLRQIRDHVLELRAEITARNFAALLDLIHHVSWPGWMAPRSRFRCCRPHRRQIGCTAAGEDHRVHADQLRRAR